MQVLKTLSILHVILPSTILPGARIQQLAKLANLAITNRDASGPYPQVSWSISATCASRALLLLSKCRAQRRASTARRAAQQCAITAHTQTSMESQHEHPWLVRHIAGAQQVAVARQTRACATCSKAWCSRALPSSTHPQQSPTPEPLSHPSLQQSHPLAPRSS